jgi:RND family efflux transporter MFP subunit
LPLFFRAVVRVATAALISLGAAACSKAVPPANPAQAAATTVTTAAAISRDDTASLDASGSFVADESADVAALSSGTVTETPASVGQFVEAGAILVRLDNREALLRLEQAKAAHQQAENDLGGAKGAAATAASQAVLANENVKRYSEMLKSGDISRSTYEQTVQQGLVADEQARTARQRVESSQAAITSARAQEALAAKAAEDTAIRAPFGGFVSERAAAVGEYVTPGLVVARVLKMTPIMLNALVPESDAGRVDVGTEAIAHVAAHPTREFRGRVRVLSPAVDANTRTLTAHIAFNNPDHALRPGMFGTVRLLEQAQRQAILIPRAAALNDGPGATQVFVISNGVATARDVRLGDAVGELVRVISGVAAGDVVATSGVSRLRDGMKVNAETR